jgi:hypothetical protein
MYQSIQITTYGLTSGVSKAKDNFILQKIHSHNKLKYGHIAITKGSAYILVYILILIQHILCLHLFLFILNIKKSHDCYNLNLLLLKMSLYNYR